MGCNTSMAMPEQGSQINGIPTAEKTIPSNSKVIDIIPRKTNEIIYSGIKNGMAIMCLDVFNSKYTGEKMARWRAASIREFDHETFQVLIHFEGWKDKHDITLKLPDDLGRLAPAEILNDQEKLEGHLLNEHQYEATEIYLKTGLLQIEDSVIEQTELVESNSTYYPGQLVDVQDVYKPKNKSSVVYKWRPGEIKEVHGPHISVHYVGWSDVFDEVIDLTVESRRIRPAGSQLPRRSPVKGKKINDSHNSNRHDELLMYKERRKSYSNVEEQRRGSFTNTYPASAVDNKGGGSQSNKIRQQKISLNEISQHSIPESEVLIESNLSKHKLQKHNSRSFKTNDISNTSSSTNNNNNPLPQRELSRNHSDPGSRLSQIVPPSHSHGNGSGVECEDDDNAIPPEIDESEYYETLRIETAFFEGMNHKGYHIVEMDGDGNCLFRSVAHQIYLDEDRHYELRLQCVQHLEKHAERFSSFYAGNFKEYLRNMKNPGVWGDDIEIKALEEMIDRLIYIYSSHSNVIEPLVTNFDEKEIMKDIQPIILSYHGKNHYNSVYDENTSLPIERRNSQILLTMRRQSYKRK